MFRRKLAAAFVLSAFITPSFALGQQTAAVTAAATNAPRQADDAISRIKDEGMKRSEAMATMRYLTDVIGARLTNSPSQRRANQWTREQLEKWGMQNAKVDSWGNFGRGWELKRFAAHVTAPEYMVVRAYPKAWSPATPGAVTGSVVYVEAKTEAELEQYRGRLKGAIVLTAPAREIKVGFDAPAERRDEADLLRLADANQPAPNAQAPSRYTPEILAAAAFNARKFAFLISEGAAALVEPSFGVDAGTIRVTGATVPQPAGANGNPFAGGAKRAWDVDAPQNVPQIVAEAEQYNRLVRLAKDGTQMQMTVDLDVKFHADDLQGYNTIAEIPGTDLKDEVVMIGAHLDSWHSGTGATDNGAGVTVVMEAMRILQKSGLKPRRTIRVALWTGEEQGLYGSRGYVSKYLGTVGDGSTAAFTRETVNGGQRLSIAKKDAYDKFAAYYNLDNGTGKIRGVYMQGNENLRPIFREWLAPFREMGASTLTVANTGGTDHLAFDAIGLPGFQFIQDPIEYGTRTWHTTQDVFDRTLEDDLKQSSVIMASFAYNSAMSDQKLPRKSNPLLSVASLLNVSNPIQAEIDERLFNASGLQYAICGHDLNVNEIPATFPMQFAVKPGETAAE